MAPRSRPELRFVVLFALGALLFELAFVTWIEEARWFARYLDWNAVWSAALLRLMGVEASSAGQVVELAGRPGIELLRGCDAVEPTGLFLLALLLFPASWRARALGALAGMLALSLLNLVRIATLALAQIHRPGWFETLHVAVWPVLFLLATLGLWILWARRARGAA
jgi:exosortase/archaeosortase family protein